MEYVAQQEGCMLEWLHGTCPECLRALSESRIDVLPVIGYSEERAKQFAFTTEFPVSTGASSSRAAARPSRPSSKGDYLSVFRSLEAGEDDAAMNAQIAARPSRPGVQNASRNLASVSSRGSITSPCGSRSRSLAGREAPRQC